MSKQDKLVELTYKFEDLMKSIKYFSTWKAKETLEKTKKICDKQKQKLISEFLEKILAFNYALPTEPQIIAIREWLEKMLK